MKILLSAITLLVVIVCLPIYSFAQLHGYTVKGIRGITKTVAQVLEYDRTHLQPATPVTVTEEFEGPEPRKMDPGAKNVTSFGSMVGRNRSIGQNSRSPLITASTPTQSVYSTFLGIYLGEGSGATSFVPPDNNGEVGSTQIVVTSNCYMKVFTKPLLTGAASTTPTGTSLTTLASVVNINLNTLFTNATLGITGMSDPHVRFDRLTGRWYIVAIDINHGTNNYCGIAVSSSATISNAASFTIYYFRVSGVGGLSTDFFDYPTLGIDKTSLYIGGNMFGASYTGSNLYVIDKTALTGGTLTVTAFNHTATGTSIYTPQGVHNDDPSYSEGYFIGGSSAFYGRLVMRRVTYPGGIPTLSASDINIASISNTAPLTVPALGSTHNLDGSDHRPYAAMIKKNKIDGTYSLWTAVCSAVNGSGINGTNNRDAAQWYQIGTLTTTPAILQSGTVYDNAATSPNYYTYPSVAMSGQGHSLMTFSSGGAGKNEQATAAGRYRTDVAGTFQAVADITTTTSAYNAQSTATQRWGDYTQTNIDPSDDQTIWTFSEYAPNTNTWGVRAAQFKAPPPATPALAATPVRCAVTPITINGTSTNNSEFFDPGNDVGGPGFNRLQVAVTGPSVVTVSNIVFVSPTQITCNFNTLNAAAGIYTVTVTNPDGQTSTTTFTLAAPYIATAAGPDNICQSATPSAYSLIGAGISGSATTGAWSIISGGGTLSSTSQTSSPAAVTYTPAANYSGSVTLRLTTNDPNAVCSPISADRVLTIVPAVSITTQPPSLTGFVGSASSFTVTASNAATYQWQVSTDNGVTFSNISNGAVYSGVTTNTMTILSGTLAMDGFQYQVVITGSSPCGSVISSVATYHIGYTWTGAVSTDWNTAGNWSGGFVPNSNTAEVTIPNVTNQPILSPGTFTIKDLTIAIGSSVTNNALFQIAGTITNNGTFTSTSGTISLVGSSAQSVTGATFASSTLNGLVINNTSGVTLTGALNITDSLSVLAGNFNAAGMNITLKSSAAITARVADLTGTISNATNITVERFYPAYRAWRLVSVPVVSSQMINAAWQEGVYNTTLTDINPNPGYGTHISGTQTPSGLGFDYTPHNNPSMQIYGGGNPIAGTDIWTGVPNTLSTNINNQPGYMLFVRGSRAVNLSLNIGAPADNTVLRTTGSLRMGTQTFPAAATSFTLIGNPYPSAIDFAGLSRTNLNNQFSVWDPYLGGLNGVGAYVTYTFVAGSYIPSVTPASAGMGQFIQSGQAFLVQNSTASAGTVVFNESNKTTGSVSTVFTPLVSLESFRTNLYKLNADSSTELVDGTVAIYNDSFSAGIDSVDAQKPSNFREAISHRNSGEALAIEARPVITDHDTLLYSISLYQIPYRLEFIANGLDHPGLSAYLHDAYLNIDTPVNLNGTTTSDFSVNADVASGNNERFSIIFKTDAPLPVTLTNVKAYQSNTGINVEWSLSQQLNIDHYEVEHSANGSNFTKSSSLAAVTSLSYSWYDASPNTGANFYRIRVVDRSGNYTFSNVVKVIIGKAAPSISVYPVPVIGNAFTLQLTNVDKGNYNVTLSNKSGQIVYSNRLSHPGGSAAQTIRLNKNIPAGAYQLKVGEFVISIIKE